MTTTNQSSLPSRVYFKNGAFYYVSPSKKWIRLGKTRDEALATYNSTVVVSTPGTVGALFDRYFREVVPGKAVRTQSDNAAEKRPLLAVFGNMKPKDVKPKHVGEYLDERAKTAPVRGNREKALLSHVFTMGMRWGLVEMNPCKGVHRNPEFGRSRYVSDVELDAVLGLANQTVKDVINFAYATAQRIGDLLEIRLDDLDETGVTIEQNKSLHTAMPVRLHIALSDDMKDIVARRSDSAVEFLFEHDGKPYTYDGFSSMFKRSVKKAIELKLIKEGFTFHDIRAKSLTDADRAGFNAQKLAGHKTAKQTAHYVKKRNVEEVQPMKRGAK